MRPEAWATPAAPEAGPPYRCDRARDRERVLSTAPHPRTATLWTAAAPLGQALARRARLALPDAGPAVARDQARGLLDPRRLARAACDDPRVFARRRPQRRVDAAVSVLLDCSGSLSTPQHRAALTAGLALALAAEALEVDAEVLGFTTLAAAAPRPGLDRGVPLVHVVLKPFDRPARACRHAFGRATGLERQNNVDGEAVAWAGARLARRGRRTRLLLVVSDGRPNTGERGDLPPDRGDPRLEAHLRQVVRDLERGGARVVGVGLAAPRVAALYPRAAVVEAPDDLAPALGEALRLALRG
ncbi:MAG: hypothetical protein M9894_07790 [Planctomycetes bacterium]|nr:hypothetical protein [Planctomycetota bacterium]